ncbi:MAG: prepilin-type N-terminal cleavage/methylation domain-containing protein [Rickettsiales bacterium]|nr:prepilin-type N-terminal cleavage/methylation domain-containing protein [Rickettsiales bacterium]
MRARQNGFTLVEMAMVVVVVALVVGGVLAGKDMLENSRRQSVINDINSYKTATALFMQRYNYMPGDFPNASTYWGASANNGGADGFIGGSTSTPLAMASSTEPLFSWQHLSEAELINGNYTGTGATYTPGSNVPRSALNNNAFSFFYAAPGSGNGYFNANYKHVIVYGSATSLATTVPTNRAGLKPFEAADIDRKIDEGMPGLGNVLSYTSHASGPTTGCALGTTSAATYVTTTTGVACSLIFITGF